MKRSERQARKSGGEARSRQSPRIPPDAEVRSQIAAFEAAVERVLALSLEDRLRKAITFTETDLGDLSPEATEALTWELRALGVVGGSSAFREPAHRNLWEVDTRPDLRELQRSISSGIRDVLQKPAGVWQLKRARYAELESGYDPKTKRHAFRVRWVGDERDAIIEGVWNLLVEVGDRLRACADPDCGKPFVAVKRQEYCTLNCSQRTRNRRKAERGGEPVTSSAG